MRNLNTFHERLKFGTKGEIMFHNRLVEYNIKCERLIVGVNQKTALENCIYGDEAVWSKGKRLTVDVKFTSFISEKSLYRFQGDYFTFMPDQNLDTAFIVTPNDLKAKLRHVDKSKGASGDAGWRIFKKPSYGMSIDIFALTLDQI